MKVESSKSVRDKIKGLMKGRVLFDEPLSRHTSFCIGGPTDYWVEPEDLEDLKRVLKFASDNHLPWKVLGRGTNILVRDEGFPGIIISLRRGYFQKLEFQGEKVIMAGAGALLSRLVSEVAQRGLRGLEFAVGIPGTVGGAMAMNAGAQGNSLAEIVGRIEVLNGKGKVLTLRKEEIGFRYRGSNLSPDRVILKVELELKRGDKKEIENLMNKFRERRNITQPLSEPSAGSIFKNPPGGISAGELIEEARLKGTCVGDAQLSPRHANFIVNRGKARAKDVLNLVEKIRKVIRERKGIKLELEIEIIGPGTPAFNKVSAAIKGDQGRPYA
ncbi:UDP-N-acetylmuramate dehydrogenase [candidate division NPL-UPA2 bacterium]|nr:UDP-N-acetylmuramate dehydrogenase [candidate division NPL-UPA2 bacterium]